MIKVIKYSNVSYKCKCPYCDTTFICDNSDFTVTKFYDRYAYFVQCPNKYCGVQVERCFPNVQKIGDNQ